MTAASRVGLLICQDLMFISKVTGTANSLGYQVETTNPKQGVIKAAAGGYACIILDLSLQPFAVADLTGAEIRFQANPRKEAIENDLIVDNRCFIELGLQPTTLDDGLLAEVVDVARRWADRCDRSRIPCLSAWTTRQAEALRTHA